MTQERALHHARKEWGDVAFARRDGFVCVIGYMTTDGKLVQMGRGISWEKALSNYARQHPPIVLP